MKLHLQNHSLFNSKKKKKINIFKCNQLKSNHKKFVRFTVLEGDSMEAIDTNHFLDCIYRVQTRNAVLRSRIVRVEDKYGWMECNCGDLHKHLLFEDKFLNSKEDNVPSFGEDRDKEMDFLIQLGKEHIEKILITNIPRNKIPESRFVHNDPLIHLKRIVGVSKK